MTWPILFPRNNILAANADEDALESRGAISVLRLTGWPNSGKTSFILRAISRPIGHEDGPPIVAFSFENGVEPFAQQRAIKVYSMVLYTDHVLAIRDMRDAIDNMSSGQYAAALIDPAEDWEDWATEYILSNSGEFGKTRRQLVDDSGKLSYQFWGILKSFERDMLKSLLARVEIVVITNHLGQRFRANMPVKGQFDPKGKKTLEQLATVTAYLIRDNEGPPAGYITKSRLEVVNWEKVDRYGVPESKPLLPTFMPEFTPEAIRYWLEHPEAVLARKEEKAPSLWELLNSPEEIAQMREDAVRQQLMLEEKRQQAQAKADGARLVKELVTDEAIFESVEELRMAGEELKAQGITLSNTAYEIYRQIAIEWKERQNA